MLWKDSTTSTSSLCNTILTTWSPVPSRVGHLAQLPSCSSHFALSGSHMYWIYLGNKRQEVIPFSIPFHHISAAFQGFQSIHCILYAHMGRQKARMGRHHWLKEPNIQDVFYLPSNFQSQGFLEIHAQTNKNRQLSTCSKSGKKSVKSWRTQTPCV